MPEFAVSPEKNRLLKERMDQLKVTENDFEEQFIRSSGKGGQHVNKNSTCVQLTHIHTRLSVKCMRERSQSVNRFLARRELLEKIASSMGLESKSAEDINRLRKQKARRKRRSASRPSTLPGQDNDN